MTIKVNLADITKFAANLYHKNGALLIALALVTIATFILAVAMSDYCKDSNNKYAKNLCFGVMYFCLGAIVMLIMTVYLAMKTNAYTIFQTSSFQSNNPINLTTAKSLQINKVSVDPVTSNLIWNYPDNWRDYQKGESFILAKVEYDSDSSIKLTPIDNTGRAYLTVANYLKRTIGVNDQVKINVDLTKTVATVKSSSGQKRIVCYANNDKRGNSETKDIVLKMKEN